MDKSQISQGAHAGVLSAINRQLSRARIWSLLLLFAFSVFARQPGASAHPTDDRIKVSSGSAIYENPRASSQDCFECQEALVGCLADGRGPLCDMQYDACIESCDNGIGSSRRIRDNNPDYRPAVAKVTH